jgi:hypothetical protein
MVHQIAAYGYTVFGFAATLFWFILIPNLKPWNPSRYTLGLLVICIAMTNFSGLIYLIRKRNDCGRWLIAAGLLGNGFSIFVIVFSLAGCIFLEYVFRM